MTNKTTLHQYLTEILGNAFLQTMYMIIVPTIIATILGFILAIILVLTKPKDFAASINPSSTSFKAFSIILAINGAAPIVIGTIAAVSPILVPIKNLVNGINATNNIINGKLLTIFTTNPTTEYTYLFGFNPFGLVKTNMIANINPKIVAIIVGTIIIYIVCKNDK